jgi:peptidoglycan hydrolase-like protein with peptidoglycan-binding domain
MFKKEIITLELFLMILIILNISLIEGKDVELPGHNILQEGDIEYKDGSPFIERGGTATINNFKIAATENPVNLKLAQKEWYTSIEKYFGLSKKDDGNFVIISPTSVESGGEGFSITFNPQKFVGEEKDSLNNYLQILSFENAKNKEFYYLGDEGKDVKLIQRLVGAEQDGIYGEQTKEAVKIWQKENGFSNNLIDGKFGVLSLQKALGFDATRNVQIIHKKGRALISKNGNRLNFDVSGDLIIKPGSRTFTTTGGKISSKIKEYLQNMETPTDLSLRNVQGNKVDELSLDDNTKNFVSAKKDTNIVTIQRMAGSLPLMFNLASGKTEGIQKKIDAVWTKIQKNQKLNSEESNFLKNFYSSLVYGGYLRGSPEASTLLKHYLEGSGNPIKIDPGAYLSSSSCKNAQDLLKEKIKEEIKNRPLSEGEVRTMTSKTLSAQTFQEGGAILRRKDCVGCVLTEQQNTRAQPTNNRYILSVDYSIEKTGNINYKWYVNDEYLFDPTYESYFYVRGKRLVVPDGLSAKLTEIIGAKTFKHTSKWYSSEYVG